MDTMTPHVSVGAQSLLGLIAPTQREKCAERVIDAVTAVQVEAINARVRELVKVRDIAHDTGQATRVLLLEAEIRGLQTARAIVEGQ